VVREPGSVYRRQAGKPDGTAPDIGAANARGRTARGETLDGVRAVDETG
jgi:hypothetical protein